MSQRLPVKTHALALRASVAHSGEYLLCTLGQLLVRILSLSPLLFAARTGSFPFAPKEHFMGVALIFCIPLWLLLVLPLRFRAGGKVSSWFGMQGPDSAFRAYPRWLAQGLGRLLMALPFLLPLMLYAGAFYYYMNVADFPSFFQMINNMGALVGGDYLHGVLLLLALLAGTVALAFWGWRRIMVFFYLPMAPLSLDGERRRRLRKSGLGKVTALNGLITFPAFALCAGLLAASLATRLTGDIQFDLMILLPALTEFDFPRDDLLLAGLLLLVLYLPFVLWRKAALAAAIHRADGRS